MKKAKQLFPLLLIIAMVLAGCTPKEPAPAGDVESGDYFTVYSGELTTINYLVTATTSEAGTAANCVDGLVEYDNLGVLSQHWRNRGKSVPTANLDFQIREGVKWVTWEGEEYADVVAQDWVDAMKYVFNPITPQEWQTLHSWLSKTARNISKVKSLISKMLASKP